MRGARWRRSARGEAAANPRQVRVVAAAGARLHKEPVGNGQRCECRHLKHRTPPDAQTWAASPTRAAKVVRLLRLHHRCIFCPERRWANRDVVVLLVVVHVIARSALCRHSVQTLALRAGALRGPAAGNVGPAARLGRRRRCRCRHVGTTACCMTREHVSAHFPPQIRRFLLCFKRAHA